MHVPERFLIFERKWVHYTCSVQRKHANTDHSSTVPLFILDDIAILDILSLTQEMCSESRTTAIIIPSSCKLSGRFVLAPFRTQPVRTQPRSISAFPRRRLVNEKKKNVQAAGWTPIFTPYDGQFTVDFSSQTFNNLEAINKLTMERTKAYSNRKDEVINIELN